MTQTEYYFCGLRRIAAISPEVKIADVDFNVDHIISLASENSDADLILFPELSITGYTCGDLFLQPLLIRKAAEGLKKIARDTSSLRACIVIGLPVKYGSKLLNCAAFLFSGKILAIVPKVYLPNYGEYYEQRWFASASDFDNLNPNYLGIGIRDDDSFKMPEFGTDVIVSVKGMKIAAEICEDLWVPTPPSARAALAGADVIVNLSASNETIGKRRYREELIRQQSARCRCVYVYASAGAGESSTDLAFTGHTAIADNGRMIAQSKPFAYGNLVSKADVDIQKIYNERGRINTFGFNHNADESNFKTITLCAEPLHYNIYSTFGYSDENEMDLNSEVSLLNPSLTDPHPFVPSDPAHKNDNCTEIINIQCHGLRQRLSAINCRKLVIGVSGGLDSTLALLVACRTFDLMGIPRSGIYGITMPGLATTSKTRNNAWQLMELLGITPLEIPIGKAVAQHFSDINQDPQKFDATYENSQARERTQIIMDYANKVGGIVLGTGDLSELALGWCTYNGDHMSMYAVNASVPKTLVRHLVEWFAERDADSAVSNVLIDIVNTPISPELVPSKDGEDEIAQKTEDLVGPYELHDFFLYHFLRNSFSPFKIFLLAREAFKGVYDEETILHWEQNFFRRFFNQQFKRSCMPDGPKVGSVCLSPRGDWRMPSDASSSLWLSQIKEIEEYLNLETGAK